MANYNIDMTQIFGVTTDIPAIGHESSTLGDDLRRAVESGGYNLPYSLDVVGDPNPAAGSFYRSDQVNFAQKGSRRSSSNGYPVTCDRCHLTRSSTTPSITIRLATK